MRDVIKEIAEKDPWVIGHSLAECFYCNKKSLDGKAEDHALDCLWVWCRERLQQRTGEEPV